MRMTKNICVALIILVHLVPLLANEVSITGNWKCGEHHRIHITDSTLISIKGSDTTETSYGRLNKNRIELSSGKMQFTHTRTPNKLILTSDEGELILVEEKYDFDNVDATKKRQTLTGSWVATKVDSPSETSPHTISHIRFHENSAIELFHEGYSQGIQPYLLVDTYLLIGDDAERSMKIDLRDTKKTTLYEVGTKTTIHLQKEDFFSNDLIEEKSGYRASTTMMRAPKAPGKSKKEYMEESLHKLTKQRKKRLPAELKELEGIWVYDPHYPLKSDKEWLMHITPYEIITITGHNIDSTPYEILPGDTLFTEERIVQKEHFQLNGNRLTLIGDYRVTPLVRKGAKPEMSAEAENMQTYLEGSWIITKVNMRKDSILYPLTEGDTAIYTFDIDLDYSFNGISKGTHASYIHNNYLWIDSEGPQKIVRIHQDSMQLADIMSDFVLEMRRKK